jgi:hypothetical protein
VSDLLDRIEKEIRERMAASRAAALEHERLQAALHALTEAGASAGRVVSGRARRRTSATGVSGSSSAGPSDASRRPRRSGGAAKSTARRAAPKSPGRSGRSSAKSAVPSTLRAPRGANREAVLRVVADRPGVTSGELADATGIKRATLSTLLGKLTRGGELERRELPSGQNGYALPAGPDAGDSMAVPAEAPVPAFAAGAEPAAAAAEDSSEDAQARSEDEAVRADASRGNPTDGTPDEDTAA